MMRAPTASRIGYFGKIPSRGDFVKRHATTRADQGAGRLAGRRSMDLLPADARWKLHYDALAPLHLRLPRAAPQARDRRPPRRQQRPVGPALSVPDDAHAGSGRPGRLRAALPAGAGAAVDRLGGAGAAACSAPADPAPPCRRWPTAAIDAGRARAARRASPTSSPAAPSARWARCSSRRRRRAQLVAGARACCCSRCCTAAPADLEKSLVLPLPRRRRCAATRSPRSGWT